MEDGRSQNNWVLFKCCVALNKSPNFSEVQASQQAQRVYKDARSPWHLIKCEKHS